jgi:hypothetical protein
MIFFSYLGLGNLYSLDFESKIIYSKQVSSFVRLSSSYYDERLIAYI